MKRKIICFALLAVLCFVLASCSEYDDVAEFKNTVYPLSEIAFADGSDWAVIICGDIYGDEGEYYICDSEEVLEKNKDKLAVDAVSQEDAQTAEDLVWVVNGGTVTTAVACRDYEFLSEAFENAFRETSFEEVNKVADLGY